MLSGSKVDQIRSLKGKMDCWWVQPWSGDNTMIEMRGLLLLTLFNWDYRGGEAGHWTGDVSQSDPSDSLTPRVAGAPTSYLA